MKIGGIVIRDSGIEGTVSGGLAHGCYLGPILFPLIPPPLCPFLDTGEATGKGWYTGLGTLWKGWGISSPLASVLSLSF